MPSGESDTNAIHYANEPLEPLIKQLGLGLHDKINISHILTSYSPTPSQLAARQVMPRDLPLFNGNPTDWPVFISNFTNSTLACGYGPAENLIRLQRCLKGPAYEAVCSRLLLPESVPHILETLRLLYGRPELLINALLEKVRAVPAPKAKKLESLIDYGLAVRSLCDHLEAANLQAHMSNQSLLHELVGRLPASVKMEWAAYSASAEEVNIKLFGVFMSNIVKSASRVTLYSGATVKDERAKAKRNAVHTHTDEVAEKAIATDRSCPACGRNHRLKDCAEFKAYDVQGKWHFVQRHGICRNCLNFHGRRTCRSNSRCGIDGCQTRHHPLLHSTASSSAKSDNYLRRGSAGAPPNSTTPSARNPAHVAGPSRQATPAENHVHRSPKRSYLFRIIPITIHGHEKRVETFAFLDEGSNLTLVEEGLIKDLGVVGTPNPLCLGWTGNVTRAEPESVAVDLRVSGTNQYQMFLRTARTAKDLSLPVQTLDYNRLKDDYTHLKGLPVASYHEAMPRILLGVDNLHLTVPLRIKEGRADEPKVAKTRLGWCIYGGVTSGTTATSVNYHACECSADDALHNLVRDYFAVEDVGITPPVAIESEADARARRIMEETTIRIGRGYQTGLLWRFDNFEFPDSYPMAIKRLECLERRMIRNPKLRENLTKQLAEYETKRYAHRATEEELLNTDPRRVWWWWRLGAVVNPKKPEKVRMIWDAAATVDGFSLNAMLHKGPDLLASLPWVLF